MSPASQALVPYEREAYHEPVQAVASRTTEHTAASEASASADSLAIKDNHLRSDIAKPLTPDILLMVFESSSLVEPVALSLVCRHWRAVACAHPTYWRSVSLTKPADGAVDFFLARVSTSSTALIAITVRTRVLTNARLVRKVLDAICENLGRIKSLDLDFDSFPSSSHHSVTRALSNSASFLQHLALRSSSPTVLLPRRLFGCELPQLQTLTLFGFDLRNSYPPAFEGAKDLSYASTTSHLNFAQALGRHRNLETLALLAFPYSSLLTAAVPSLGKLSTLHLDVFGHGLLLLLDSLQHLHTISVSMLSGCPAADDAFFRHLKGDLHMTLPLSGWDVDSVPCTVCFEFVEIGPSKRSRCVTKESMTRLLYEPLADDTVIVNLKITTATIPSSLLSVVDGWFGHTLSLRHLRVVLDKAVGQIGDAYSLLTGAHLHCPKLEKLEVVNGCPGRTSISQNDLDYLVLKVLGVEDQSVTLEIVLENVTISGDDRFADDQSSGCGSSDFWEYECPCDGDGCEMCE